ncbi:MAG: peptide-methionine (S)-S-oxide reductase MsrA [Buchananella hordeovulneris]|nr:peptide-methionine (S)-S-oxide reductase MsrA [Buchananella hordeovulneris]
MNFVSLQQPEPGNHTVLNVPLEGSWPAGSQEIYLALGCFWGAEKLFWTTPGVVCTSVGYMGGHTEHPTYREVCSGNTGHAETVRVVFDPAQISVAQLLSVFWENHDPTQGNRQGNDVGPQYRSVIFFTSPEQEEAALASRAAFGAELAKAGFGAITTAVLPAGRYWLAEDYHQQYLDKNPGGYCPVHATGVKCSPAS